MPKPRVTSIVISGPNSITIPETQTLTANVLDQNGRRISPTPNVQWRSSNPAVLRLNASGGATGVSVGTATVTASVGSVSSAAYVIDVVAVPVPPPTPTPPPPQTLTSVAVSPSTIPVGQGGFAYALDQNGAPLTSAVTWQSQNPSVATVTSGGGVTGVSVGSCEIKAISSGTSVETQITVTAPSPPAPVPTPTITTVTLMPASILVGAQATATARDQNGNILSVGVTWSLGTPSKASVTAAGVLTGLSAGSTTVVGTLNGVTASATLTVTALPVPPPSPPVLVRPANSATIAPSFVAELSFEAGPTAASFELRTTGNVTIQSWPFTFANTTTSLVQTLQITSPVSGTYKVVGIVSAVATTAATVTLSVPAPPAPSPLILTTVTLNPFSLIVGQTATALAKDQNGNALSAVTWSSSNTVLATVAANGTVTSRAVGAVQISATYNGVIVSATLTINPVVVPPPSGSKRVIQAKDLVYLGALRVNDSGVRLDFSYGQLTGRRVNGQVRLIMAGNIVQGAPVYEFSDPGGYSTTPNSAPKMPLVRNWGNIYGTARTTWDTQGVEQPIPALYMGGIHWSESQQLLYWTYLNTYNTTGLDDWCLGATELAVGGPIASGPWRPSGGGKKGPWRCTRVTEHPTTGEMLCGATLASGNNKSPWGPDMWVGSFPTAATPAGYGNPDIAISKYLTYYTMFGRINTTTGTWTGNVTSCRRPGDYFFEPGYTNTHIDPTLNGGIGSWTELDFWNDMTWIDLPDCHGVIYTGVLASAHEWYSTANQNHINCSHGVPPPVTITGPVSTDAYPFMAIYNPDDLTAVRNGSRVDYTVDPAQLVNARAQWNLQTAPINSVGSARSISGQYFDAVTRKLYICAPEAEVVVQNQYYLPIVHVFQLI